MSSGVAVSVEAIATLRRNLASLPTRHPERRPLMASTAELYGVSRATLYRLLREPRPRRDAHRTDRGVPRVMPAEDLEWWCEVVAAIKSRTTNKLGRRLSTRRILEIVAEHGVETPDRGLTRLAPGRLTASTLNRHMQRLGFDMDRMTREPPAVRFQAERSYALWHFDMSPSDLKQLKPPTWVDPDRQGAPTLMLFSVVDDRSGVAVQEYALVCGEDVKAALRFLFRAMAPKDGNPLGGIPEIMQLEAGRSASRPCSSASARCVSISVCPGIPPVSCNVRQQRSLIARPTDHHCEPLQVGGRSAPVPWSRRPPCELEPAVAGTAAMATCPKCGGAMTESAPCPKCGEPACATTLNRMIAVVLLGLLIALIVFVARWL